MRTSDKAALALSVASTGFVRRAGGAIALHAERAGAVPVPRAAGGGHGG